MKSGYNVWSNKPLADLTATDRPICYGIVQTGPELPGGIPCVRVIDIKSGKVDVSRLIHTSTEIHESYKRTQLQVGDLLFALRGKIGELAIVDSKLEGGNLTRGVALIALTESYSPEFYLQFLSSEETKKRLNNALNGSALKEITIDTLRKFAVPTPELPEQKAIAKALSDTDALIAALEKLITKKRAIKTATMQQLLTGKNRLPSFGEGKGYKDSELGRIPEDWEIVELGKLCRLVNGRGFKPHEWASSGLPIIRIQNLNGSDDFNYYSGSFDKKIFIRKGDLLFAWSGSRGTSFGPHVWRGVDAVLNYHTWKVDVREEIVRKVFLEYALKQLTAKIEDTAHGASALVHVQKWEMEKYEISIPSSLEEQQAISDLMSKLDLQLKSIEKLKEKYLSIKSTMMQQLLTGRTRLV